MEDKTIIFTGGHHNSAIIIAKKLKSEGFNIVWLGHKHTMKDDDNISQEYKDISKAGIKFIELKSTKFHQGNPFNYFKIIKSFLFCLKLFRNLKPKLVVSFGGYLSVPAVLASWFLKIPVIGHEQTQTLGLANKFNLKFYNKLFLTWPIPELKDNPKCQVIGLPLDITEFNKITLKDLGLTSSMPLLVVSGGKQGSQIINKTILKLLPALLKSWNIYHQTGHNLATHDFENLQKYKKSLSSDLQENYQIVDYSYNFKSILSIADLVIGRSGAHTVYELLILKKKFIAIPLPFSSANEQLENAKLLQKLGLALIIDQKDLTPESLNLAIIKIKNQNLNYPEIDSFVSNIPKNADQIIIQEIKKIII